MENHWPEERVGEWSTVFDEERYLRFGFVGSIRPLLGRRLAREGRYVEARVFLPESVSDDLDAFALNMAAGTDASKSDAARATGLWGAARVAQRSGMELFGTELAPDWHVYDGGFVGSMTPDGRTAEGPAAVSEKELQKVALTGASNENRFHYRYIAADLAWQAAELMPDTSHETARVLCIAGSWLKLRDPKAADRFYKALVRRCGNTPLGREADRLRWFPVIEE